MVSTRDGQRFATRNWRDELRRRFQPLPQNTRTVVDVLSPTSIRIRPGQPE
jgi:hypothetical protein